MVESKLLPENSLVATVSEWRTAGLVIGFTCGAFDLLHAGHVDYLQRARSLCDRLIVAVNSDESIRSYKSPLRPIISQEHRLSVVAALSCADAVTLMTDRRPARLIERLRPDLYIKGGDYEPGLLRSAPLVESYGGRCVVIPVEHEISTSFIIRRIEHLSIYSTEPLINEPRGRRLILLDRDGTLIENVPFLNEPFRVRLLDGVGPGLRLLQDAGFRLAILSNQQGLGLGYFDYDVFVSINSELLRQIAVYGVGISKFFFCPHSFAEACECRKPGTKLIERALRDYDCDPGNCFVIGDAATDMAAARSSGCTALLVGEGGLSFAEAVETILQPSTLSTPL